MYLERILCIRYFSKKEFQPIAKKIPLRLKNKGRFLILNGINSRSEPTLFALEIKIAFPQKVVPKPTNASFNT